MVSRCRSLRNPSGKMCVSLPKVGVLLISDLSVASQGLLTLHQGSCLCDVYLKIFFLILRPPQGRIPPMSLENAISSLPARSLRGLGLVC